MSSADGHELLEHLLTDYLWKVGIVAALAILGLLAAVVIWKRVGRGPGDR